MIFSTARSLGMMLTVGAMFLATPGQAMPVISFDFDPSAVSFDAGGTINFDMDSNFDDFSIVSQVGGGGHLTSLNGEIDGHFSYSASGDIVTTGGGIRIDDGGGSVLSGDLDFTNLAFDEGPFQFITLTGVIDFDTPYAGTNADLAALAGFGSPFLVSADFLYSGLTNLAALITFGDGSGSQIAALGTVEISEPQSLAMLGLGLLGLGFLGRRRRHSRPD